jgi:hypothetical protein
MEIFVSPAGDDANAGTLAEPVRTIQRAQTLARLAVSIPQDVNIWLRGGTYRLSSTLELGAADSAQDRYLCRWRAYQGEDVTLSGGIQLGGWTAAQGGVYEVVSPNRTRRLYIDGSPATRARKPSAGQYSRMVRWYYSEKPHDSVDQDNRGVVCKWEDISPGFVLNGTVELVVQKDWCQHRFKINGVPSYPVENGIQLVALDLDPAIRDASFNCRTPHKLPGHAYHLEGDISFLTDVGEWLDDGQKLYYKPAAADFLAVVPIVDTLVLFKNAKNIWMEGIKFSDTGWNGPTALGYANWWGNQKLLPESAPRDAAQTKTPATIEAEYSTNVRLLGCEVANAGAIGIALRQGSRQCVVEDCHVHDIAGTGIVVHGLKEVRGSIYYYDTANPVEYAVSWHENEIINCPEADQAVSIRIRNNLLERFGTEYGGIGIYAPLTKSTIIEHNELRDPPATGISLGWGFTTDEINQSNNLVKANLIKNPMSLFTDGGGIYQMSRSNNTRIEENVIDGLVAPPWAARKFVCALYLEYGCAGVTWQNNVLQNVQNNPTQSQPMWANAQMADNIYTNNDQILPTVISNAGRQPSNNLNPIS